MRVLVVHNRYRPTAPSGEDIVVDQESAALAARGHDVAIFERRSAEIASWSLPRRATLPARVVWNPDSRRALSAELARFRPDVVHVHNTFPLLSPSVLHACRDAGVPLVATIHNYKLGCASGELFRAGAVCHDCLGGPGPAVRRPGSRSGSLPGPLPGLLHGCYRGSPVATAPIATSLLVHARAWRSLVSAYVFISQAQRDVLAPLGLPADRSFVKHNFVPPFPGTGPDGAGPERGHRVAFVGRLDPAKGAPFLLRAWDAFRSRRPASTLRLEVAGGGPLADEVARWGAARPSVDVLGLVPRAEVARILARARAAVVPSQWEETFGLIAVEAMAVGTPPVASAHGAFPEFVVPGVNGALFAPTDVGALVDVLADVDDHPERYAAYGREAYATYRNRFAPEGNLDLLMDVYRFAVDHPIGRISRSPGIAGRSGRSPS